MYLFMSVCLSLPLCVSSCLPVGVSKGNRTLDDTSSERVYMTQISEAGMTTFCSADDVIITRKQQAMERITVENALSCGFMCNKII